MVSGAYPLTDRLLDHWRASLFPFLRELQQRYRPPNLTFPDIPGGLAAEAEKGIFNSDHITSVLVGHRGPWNASHRGGNLVFILNALEKERRALDDTAQRHAARARRNKKLASLLGRVKAMGLDDVAEYLKARIVPARGWRAKPRMGITVHPSKDVARQAFWTSMVVPLVEYLRRTTPEKEGALFYITSKILHLASAGAFPSGRSGAARVKQRYYRAKGWTKSTAAPVVH